MAKIKSKKPLKPYRFPYPVGIELSYAAALLKILKNSRRLFDSLVMPHVVSGLAEMKRIRRFDNVDTQLYLDNVDTELYLINQGVQRATEIADDFITTQGKVLTESVGTQVNESSKRRVHANLKALLGVLENIIKSNL